MGKQRQQRASPLTWPELRFIYPPSALQEIAAICNQLLMAETDGGIALCLLLLLLYYVETGNLWTAAAAEAFKTQIKYL